MLFRSVVLGVITGVQAIVLVLFGAIGRAGPDPGNLFELMLAIMGVTICSMCLGLILSVVVTNADRVMPLLVLVIMLQLLLSGGLFPVKGRPVLAQLSWLTPSRWAFAAGASDLNIVSISGNLSGDAQQQAVDFYNGQGSAPSPDDGLWKHSLGVYFGDMFALFVLTCAFIAITGILLRRVGRIKALH